MSNIHIASPTPTSTSGSVKRKKGTERSMFHQTQSVAVATRITDDDDADRPPVRQRTVYIAEPDVNDTEEDTDTLARASQLEGFSYLLGESISSDTHGDDSDILDGINVQVPNVRKYYNSTVSVLLD